MKKILPIIKKSRPVFSFIASVIFFLGFYLLLTMIRVSADGTFTVNVVSTTNTQAVLSYTAPDGNDCTVQVSEDSSLSPLVHDIDPLLFTGSNLDSQSEALKNNTNRIFIVGKRMTEKALDGNNYSRALQAFTTHYYQITCGASIATGNFTTANIPFGMTYQDIPQVDPANPGATIMPTLFADRTQTIVDPHTGALVRRISLPTDGPFNPGNPSTFGPFMYYGGFIRVCGVSLVGSPAIGYLCTFSQGDGGPTAVYYVIPSTGESRYLGWTFAVSVLNPTYSEFFTADGTDVFRTSYSGTYVSAPGSSVSLTRTTLLSNLPAAIHTFNSAFVPADFSCGASSSMGDYIIFQCKRGNQDTYGWVVVVRISTASVIAAAQTYNNIQCRWCAIHQTYPMYDQGAVGIETHSFVGGGIGGGPYTSTYAGAGVLPAGSTAITVSGEPACASCGEDSSVPVAQVGDQFQFTSDGTNETVTVTAKNSPTSWTISPTVSSHPSGAVLTAVCKMTPIFWKFLADPNGTDITNTNFVADPNWPMGGHDDATTGLQLTEGGQIRYTASGDLLSLIGQPLTRTIPLSPSFAGADAGCNGNACTQHPSAGAPGAPWYMDFTRFDGVGSMTTRQTLTQISGQLYKFSTEYAINPKYFAMAGVTDAPWSTGGKGPHEFLDVSPAALSTTSADSYKYCIANAAGECNTGSAKGDVFINLPGTPNLFCQSWGDPCFGNFSAYNNAIIQIGTVGSTTRVISGGLVGLRDMNDYPTAKPLTDGSYAMFAYGRTAPNPPSQLLMAKLPPFTASDNVDRSTFVRAPISLTVPQGKGITQALVEFGYLEQGTPGAHYCTSRLEPCVVVSAAVSDANPFSYEQTDTYSKMPCATTCTIILPVLPMHIAYYQIKYYDVAGVFVQNGDQGVAAESAVANMSSLNMPDAPVIGTATAGDISATVTFTAPVSNGGADIDGYTVNSIPSGGTDANANTTGLSHSITGLTNGSPYTFTVKAHNLVGNSVASAESNSVTPTAPVVPVVPPPVVSYGGGGGGGGYTPPATVTPPATYTATVTPSYNLGFVTLKSGSKGDAVKELQRLLNDKLNLGLILDGKLGPKTIAVIKQWQKNHGLVADGLVGAKTKSAMILAPK